MGLHYDPTINFGTLVALAVFVTTIIGGWYTFRIWMSVQLSSMRQTLDMHATELEKTTNELAEHRRSHQKLLAEVQVLVGQMSMLMKMQDRRGARG